MAGIGIAAGFGRAQRKERALELEERLGERRLAATERGLDITERGTEAEIEANILKNRADTAKALGESADKKFELFRSTLEKATPEARENILTNPAYDIFADQFTKAKTLSGETEESAKAQLDLLQFVEAKPPKPRTPSVNADIIFPLLKRKMDGETLPAAQEAVLQEALNADPLRQIFRGMFGGGAGAGGVPGMGGMVPQLGGMDEEGLLQQGRDAIGRGAPRDAVMQELSQQGIDPGRL